jgi:hypothetical protein
MSRPVKLPEELIVLVDAARGPDTPGHHLLVVYKEYLDFKKTAEEITHPDLVKAKGITRALKDHFSSLQQRVDRLGEEVGALAGIEAGLKALKKLGKL